MFERLRLPLASPRFRLMILAAALVLATFVSRPAAAINCTFQFCPLILPPCPGTFISNEACCRPGTSITCFYFVNNSGCLSGISAFCS